MHGNFAGKQISIRVKFPAREKNARHSLAGERNRLKAAFEDVQETLRYAKTKTKQKEICHLFLGPRSSMRFLKRLKRMLIEADDRLHITILHETIVQRGLTLEQSKFYVAW